MSRTTITVSVATKRLLDLLRGDKEWDEFLRELALDVLKKRKKKALMKLKKLVTKQDLETMEKNYEEVRIRWHLRKES